MKIQYFQDTDTLYVEFLDQPTAETREINANLMADFAKDGRVVGVTLEHASEMDTGTLEMVGFPMQVRAPLVQV